MGFKPFAVAAVAMALTGFAARTPAAEPWDPRQATTSVMYFVSVPLDATTRKQREPYLGMMLQGKREYHAAYFDTRMLNFIDGGISAKVLIAGAVAVGGIMAAGGGGSSGGASGANPPAQVQPATTSSSTASSPSAGTTSGGSGGGTGGSAGGSSGSTGPCPPTPCK